ncbi:MAG TPA: chorismate-binding protein [Spirochaetia bacterium]|nr:chorismate-binding protein [Spirochaetia bacterium]
MRKINGERFTPLSLAKKLGAVALLESASFQRGRERFSFLILKEAFRVFQKGDELFMKRDGSTLAMKGRPRGTPASAPGDILDVLAHFARQHEGISQPFPLPTGGIGFLSYEYSRRFDTMRMQDRPDPLGLPDAMFLLGNLFLVFDHYTDTITLVGLNYREKEIDLERALDEAESRINDLDFNFMAPVKKDWTVERLPREDDRAGYLRGVERVKEEIVKGNLLQGVLSRRLQVRTDMPAIEAYRALRSGNPSPYMFYLDFGDFQLFGASPEVHVKARDGVAAIRPLAGTRRRGATPAEDAALEKELLADPKERAEHLMLVDLARNDLGRVCAPGTVQVTELMEVERYSHVMHIVSHVEGKLAEGRTGLDALRATFPAGTVSGAPKIRAVEIIDSLEPVRRGFYAGVVAHVEADGSLDSCISIRCAVRQGDLVTLQAGAGIVADSVPEKEYEETEAKLGALARALGMEV